MKVAILPASSAQPKTVERAGSDPSYAYAERVKLRFLSAACAWLALVSGCSEETPASGPAPTVMATVTSVPPKATSTLVAPNPQSVDPSATPRAFGPYRLVPPGAGQLPSEAVSAPAGVQTANLEVLGSSPLFREVPASVLPPGLRLLSGDTGQGDTGFAVHLLYGGEDRATKLEIYRLRPRIRPIDITYTDGGMTKAQQIDGRFALIAELLTPPPLPHHADQTRRVYETQVRMGVEGLEVLVISQHYDATVLIEVAKTLVP